MANYLYLCVHVLTLNSDTAYLHEWGDRCEHYSVQLLIVEPPVHVPQQRTIGPDSVLKRRSLYCLLIFLRRSSHLASMRFRRITSKIRRSARPLCGWSTMALYLLVASGFPLRLPDTSEKDLSTPFPCMNCPCGCRNAEQCWRSCCCHTLAERLAWAHENHVQPPDYVLAEARAQGIDVCEYSAETHACCCCCAKMKARSVRHDNSVVLIQALRCSGLGGDWIRVGIATAPLATIWEFQLTVCGQVHHPTVVTSSPAFGPLLPPPRPPIG
jgi:hypothetical protein